MRQADENSIRVRYDHQETGWAVPVEPGLAVVENIPLTHRCNLGDLVRLEEPGPDGLPWVGPVLHRRFTGKTALYYHGPHELQLLVGLLKLLGCETEGVRRPIDFTPGVLLVAHDRHVRPDLLAGAAGIPQPRGVPTRVALQGGCLVADTGELRLETDDGFEVARWRQEDWRREPGLAVQAMDRLYEAVCRGLAGRGADDSPHENGNGGTNGIGDRPLTIRFRRWRHLR